MSMFEKMMVTFLVSQAVQMIERSSPTLKGPEKYKLAVEALKSWGVEDYPEIEAIINAQVAMLNQVNVFKPGLPF